MTTTTDLASALEAAAGRLDEPSIEIRRAELENA